MSIVIVLVTLLVVAFFISKLHFTSKSTFTAPEITEQEIHDDLNSHVEYTDVLSPESVPPPSVVEAITVKEVKKSKSTPKQKSTKPKAKAKKLDA